ncbi:platelet-activating factor acetylhydrolase IB subunit alpha1 isoform X2 [Hydra vulgaris]|uniref:Platelet-activating factor acetylhydrolase IB subunit alpha1 isoform X2 n=1 Tax=Hydra vulgaris TaxID=6087 RepID=A0ABM4B428_HYDVU
MKNSALEPSPIEDVVKDNRWMSLHSYHIKDCQVIKPDVLFIGDSIVHRFQDTQIWKEEINQYKIVNAGMPGDCTENVLWRLSNGLLEACSPKIVLIWVGTNNHKNTSEEIVEALEAIVWKVTSHNCKSVVLGILPRGEKPNCVRDKINEINSEIKKIVNSIPNAFFLSVDPGFVREDSTISHEDMMDFLHPSTRGYKRIAPYIISFLKKHLK